MAAGGVAAAAAAAEPLAPYVHAQSTTALAGGLGDAPVLAGGGGGVSLAPCAARLWRGRGRGTPRPVGDGGGAHPPCVSRSRVRARWVVAGAHARRPPRLPRRPLARASRAGRALPGPSAAVAAAAAAAVAAASAAAAEVAAAAAASVVVTGVATTAVVAAAPERDECCGTRWRSPVKRRVAPRAISELVALRQWCCCATTKTTTAGGIQPSQGTPSLVRVLRTRCAGARPFFNASRCTVRRGGGGVRRPAPTPPPFTSMRDRAAGAGAASRGGPRCARQGQAASPPDECGRHGRVNNPVTPRGTSPIDA